MTGQSTPHAPWENSQIDVNFMISCSSGEGSGYVLEEVVSCNSDKDSEVDSVHKLL